MDISILKESYDDLFEELEMSFEDATIVNIYTGKIVPEYNPKHAKIQRLSPEVSKTLRKKYLNTMSN